VTIYEHINHALFEKMCVCLLCFMVAGCTFMEKGECGCFL
jgi:hypothetical protein